MIKLSGPKKTKKSPSGKIKKNFTVKLNSENNPDQAIIIESSPNILEFPIASKLEHSHVSMEQV